MRFEIVLSPRAAAELRHLAAFKRAVVKDALEVHLRHEPSRVSKSRIKRLRGLTRPQYRLRVEEVRVFYDVTDKEVQILAIVAKSEAAGWRSASGEAGP
jgi:mRNA interferase RelE/StbE